MNMEPAAKIPTALNSITDQVDQGNLMLFGQSLPVFGLTYQIFKMGCTIGQVIPKKPMLSYIK